MSKIAKNLSTSGEFLFYTPDFYNWTNIYIYIYI